MISKIPRAFAQINKEAIKHNYREIKNKIPPDLGIMAIVKADGYGHGAIEVSKLLEKEQVDYLAVAIAEEGVELRKAGITAPILVLGYTPSSSISMLIDNDLTQTIFTYEMAKYISSHAEKQGKKVKIHIKIDTGMGRIGFMPQPASIQEIARINQLSHVKIEGIYTHFSSADEEDQTYTNRQASIFYRILRELEALGIEFLFVHMANSAAILMDQYAGSNMVRIGISLYGYHPSEVTRSCPVALLPAMTLKTQIVHVKKVSKGEAIGYNRKYTTQHTTKIATIPIGYADGYNRKMSNKGHVLIKGERAPVVGNICMDQFMVDVSHINNVAVEDEVVIFGEQNNNEITVEQIAEISDTNSYEIICMIGKRIPRIYV